MSIKKLVKRMNVLTKTNLLERSIATSMIVATADRIFNQGKDANNTGIGTYSSEYLKQRRKDGYPNSTKVILQATRQMVNDWSVINIGKQLGLGFKNAVNADKSEWVEATYKKDIFKHTENEKQAINKLVDKEVKKIING
ncbi:MAG: hypothetical protein JXQ96_23350 [Cyclobacteriaceae bacterium]